MRSYIPVENPTGAELTGLTGLLEERKYQLLSSALNLIIIGINGQIFYAIARKLTNWENHRTQSEVENGLVAKNFAFQFINNYFVLFCQDPRSAMSSCKLLIRRLVPTHGILWVFQTSRTSARSRTPYQVIGLPQRHSHAWGESEAN